MAITATDNEELATELWGENKYWDEDRQQFLPKVGDDVSVGSKRKASSTETERSDESKQQDHQRSAQTTEPTSSSGKGGTTAHSTGGSGTVKKSPGK